MATPLISICVPNLNKARYLPERMETLLAQTFNDWEIIVCDSYSNDGSWEFFQKFKNDSRIHLHQVPKAGLYAGWNECLTRARGEYIYIATSDDTAEPNLLESLIMPLERRRELHLAACDFNEINENSQPVVTRQYRHRDFFGEWMNVPHIRNGKAEFLLKCCFGTTWVTFTSVLFRRTMLDRIGLFKTTQQSHADIEWSMRACLTTDIAYIPGALSHWRVYTGQATPARQTIEQTRIVLASLAHILKSERNNIPADWQKIADWENNLLSCRRAMALEAYQLYRWEIKRSPSRFVANALSAARHEPSWFLSRMLRGFPPGNELKCDYVATAHRLFKLFTPPWPPHRIERW